MYSPSQVTNDPNDSSILVPRELNTEQQAPAPEAKHRTSTTLIRRFSIPSFTYLRGVHLQSTNANYNMSTPQPPALVEFLINQALSSQFTAFPQLSTRVLPDILITDWDIIHGYGSSTSSTTQLQAIAHAYQHAHLLPSPLPLQDPTRLCIPNSDAYTLPPSWHRSHDLNRVSTSVSRHGVVLTRRKQRLKGCMWKNYTCLWKRRDCRGKCTCRGRALDLGVVLLPLFEVKEEEEEED